MGTVIDLTGKRFGRLTVVSRAENHITPCGTRKVQWNCLCDCGKTVTVWGSGLKNGTTQSCGCLQRYLVAERLKTHGMTKSRLYTIWANMKQRCFNKKDTEYQHYGGRGITVCEEWIEFENFKDWALNNGYADNLTIDRINNDGNYEPSNCRWATRTVQMNNMRTNNIIEHKGRKQTLAEWAREYGIHRRTLTSRLEMGYTFEQALKKKPRINRNSIVVNYNGEEMNISQLAEKLNVSVSLIGKDLKNGKTVEETIRHAEEVGKKNRKGGDFI